MSAETLRRAAALMRERADRAAEPWFEVDDLQPWFSSDGTRSDAEHIASWPPGVALEVAVWLDEAADTYEPEPDAGDYTEFIRACVVARAYLGDES